MKQLLDVIQTQNQTLELNAKQIQKLTLVEERNRLSRELHDTVGHTFTSTIMGMDAVYYLIDVSPEEAKKNLLELRQMTHKGLDEVRNHIHHIAPDQDERPLYHNIEQISQDFAQHTGTRIQVHTNEDKLVVAETIQLTFMRCLQEALTNSVRHGMASNIDVHLIADDQLLTLKIIDDGQGTDALEAGFGLNGMLQRLKNLNGTLDVKSTKGTGTAVVCCVPRGFPHSRTN